MKSLVLLRHGESLWNKANRFTGWTDVGLTAHGVQEARAAGRTLRQAGPPAANAGKFTVSVFCRPPVTVHFWPLAGRLQRRNRRTEVLLIPNCLAMAD